MNQDQGTFDRALNLWREKARALEEARKAHAHAYAVAMSEAKGSNAEARAAFGALQTENEKHALELAKIDERAAYYAVQYCLGAAAQLEEQGQIAA